MSKRANTPRAATVRVEFSRDGSTGVKCVAFLPNRTVVTVPQNRFNGTLPHDLVHLLVEQYVGVKDGFWGQLAAGVRLQGFKVTGGRSDHRSGMTRAEITVEFGDAEALVAAIDGIFTGEDIKTWGSRREFLANTRYGSILEKAQVTSADIDAMCLLLATTRETWQNLEPDGKMTFLWPGTPTILTK